MQNGLFVGAFYERQRKKEISFDVNILDEMFQALCVAKIVLPFDHE